MNMPIADDNTVHFTSTLMALIRTALEIKLASGVLAQRLCDADLKREIRRVWPNLQQKTIDLLVTPHKYNELTVGKVYAAHMIFDYYKQNRAKKLQQQNPSGISQSKLGALFRPVLPFTHLHEPTPPIKPAPPPEPEPRTQAPPTSTSSTATNVDANMDANLNQRTSIKHSQSGDLSPAAARLKPHRRLQRGQSEDVHRCSRAQERQADPKPENMSDAEGRPGLEGHARAASLPRLNAEYHPIVDLSPIKRSASSLTPQQVGLRDYDLERVDQSRFCAGPDPDRTHHHHHHHRCHRRRDKDKDRKQKSLDKTSSAPPSGTVGSFEDPSADGLSRERARERDRSRPHERRHHSSAGEKQRYYSCERYGNREPGQARSAGPSRSTSPGESQDSGLIKQQGSTVTKLPSGTSAQARGRRQLPQTPLTPRPAVAYKTPTSSAAPPSASTPGSRFVRGASEHDRLLAAHEEPKAPAGPDFNPSRQQLDSSLLEEGEDFQDAVSSHGGGHSSRSATTPSTAAAQGRAAGVPNGYHFTLGSAPGSSRGAAGLREREEEDWC